MLEPKWDYRVRRGQRTVCHRDGRVSYLSALDDLWHWEVRVVPSYELDALPIPDQERVVRHLNRQTA